MQRILYLLIACLSASQLCIGQFTSSFKTYSGTIDKYPVTLYLHQAAHKYTGFYYYHSKEQPIYITGDDTTAGKGKIRLSAFIPGKESDESFEFSTIDKNLSGQWKTGNDQPSIFSAAELTQALAFDYVFTTGETPLRPKLKGSPVGTFEAASVWPRGNSIQALFLKKLIRKEFDDNTSTEDIGKLFLRQKNKFFSDYINDNKVMKDEDLKDAYSYNLDQSDAVMISFQSPKILVLAHSNYAYTGGAHGNYGTTYIAIDLISNKKLLVNDVLTKAGQQKLSALLESSFRQVFLLKATDSLSGAGLFDNRISPNENFYVTSKGIGFSYMPYEIGPYAMGEINLFVPFTELNAFLKPSFKILLQ